MSVSPKKTKKNAITGSVQVMWHRPSSRPINLNAAARRCTTGTQLSAIKIGSLASLAHKSINTWLQTDGTALTGRRPHFDRG